MADKAYDAVVIGGGHHGTIIAPYLAKAGMKVGVFERLASAGVSNELLCQLDAILCSSCL
jgi:glycine/D-amino acid oxidase-like deaminating enzyme